MSDYALSGIVMVIIGVLLIVIGGGTAFTGMNKMNAAEKWEESQTETTCKHTYSVDMENSTRKEVENQIQNQSKENSRECVTTKPQSNPYSGGQTDIGLGAILVILGGSSTYFGNKI